MDDDEAREIRSYLAYNGLGSRGGSWDASISRARTVELSDADRGTVDNARGVDLRVGFLPECRQYVRHERVSQ